MASRSALAWVTSRPAASAVAAGVGRRRRAGRAGRRRGRGRAEGAGPGGGGGGNDEADADGGGGEAGTEGGHRRSPSGVATSRSASLSWVSRSARARSASA